MASITITAAALMRLTTKIRERAAKHVTGFDLITATLGPGIANWAYADRGKEPGQRVPSRSEQTLRAWDGRREDWACILSNRTGAGKTIAAARYVADRGGLILRAADADGWGFDGSKQIRRSADADLLLIDDMGLEQTGPGSGHIAAIILLRAARWAKTVGTTTLALVGPSGSILALYGEATESRLRAHHHNLTNHREPDRRGMVMPVMDGFIREQQIAHFAESVRYVAAGLIEEQFAVAEVERFAMFAGVKLDSQEMRAMEATIERERAERTASVEAMISELRGLGQPVQPTRVEDYDIAGWEAKLGYDIASELDAASESEAAA